jgi:pyruvate/2-oxoglutarate dehydrogenase complex dihydrolipoamide acyltransferase (E2) component
MATEFVMPKLGHLMEQARVARWIIRPGQPVAKGEALLEVETDKAVLEVESPFTGTLIQILVEDGTDEVPVGAPLALYEEGGS